MAQLRPLIFLFQPAQTVHMALFHMQISRTRSFEVPPRRPPTSACPLLARSLYHDRAKLLLIRSQRRLEDLLSLLLPNLLHTAWQAHAKRTCRNHLSLHEMVQLAASYGHPIPKTSCQRPFDQRNICSKPHELLERRHLTRQALLLPAH